MAAGDGIPDLADKLNHLFATVPAPTRSGLYTNELAAKDLGELGVTVTDVHIAHLRSGRRDNPSAKLLGGLAKLFGVPIGYFFDPTTEEQVKSELASLVAIKDTQAKSLMLRAQGLSPESKEHLSAILDRIRKIEGLDDRGRDK